MKWASNGKPRPLFVDHPKIPPKAAGPIARNRLTAAYAAPLAAPNIDFFTLLLIASEIIVSSTP
jgi:hypothetical protein